MAASVSDLIDPAQAGEQPAFQSIVGEHHVLIFNVCLRMLGDWHEVQDVTQDGFFKAYKALPQLRDKTKTVVAFAAMCGFIIVGWMIQ